MRNETIIRSQQNLDFAINHLRNLKIDPEKPFTVIVELFKKKRSLSQNALMWKWLNQVVDIVGVETGNDADQIHYWFKTKFLPATIVQIGNEVVEYRTTTSLTTAEMSEYMTRIHAFVTQDLGIFLTLPEERFAA